MSQKISPSLRATGMALAAGLGAPVSQARPPAAGTDISNVATVSYLNTQLGLTETLQSNTVFTRIGDVAAISITDDQSVSRAPGDNALMAFRLKNVGNIEVEVDPDLDNFGGAFNFSRAAAFIDSNKNGRIDPADKRVEADTRLKMDLGEEVAILFDARVPDDVAAGGVAFGELGASIVGSGGSVSALGEVVVVDAVASLTNSADVIENTSGGEIIYTLTLRNNSDDPIEPTAPFDGLPVNLDGIEQTLLLVRDPIPVNTDFKRIVDAVSFDPVFHRRGDAPEVWSRTQPEDRGSVDAIGFVSDDPLLASVSLDFSFAVEIGEHTGGAIVTNEAEVFLPDGEGGAVIRASNLVNTPIEGASGTLNFFSESSFETPVNETGFDEMMFAEAASGACNVSANIDEIDVEFITTTGGDRETFIARETAPDSGVFRVSDIQIGNNRSVLEGDGIVQGKRRSVIEATVDCDPNTSGALALSPAGAVFLSATNEPVPGARVELLDASGTLLTETVTDAEGFYEIAPELSGTHTVRVTPQGDFVAPSRRESYVGFGRNVVAGASFAEPFVLIGGATLNIDVPVDPNLEGALRLAISADRREAQIGDVIQYTMDVQNTASVAVQASEIFNDLPRGVDFIGGSALLEGSALADPGQNSLGQFVFPIGKLEPNQRVSVIYAAKVLPTAGNGDLFNRAFAQGQLVGFTDTVVSNTGSVAVAVNNEGGVFSREGVILGKVFADCNANGIQDGPGEPGIPGVQIHTQEGLSVITDHSGRYSLSPLDPRTHILDIRESSLPDGMSAAATRVFDAGRGGSRFVPLRAGDIRTEDFAVQGCNEDVLDNLQTMLAQLEEGVRASGLVGGGQGAIAFDRAKRGIDTVHSSAPEAVQLATGPVSGEEQETASPPVQAVSLRDLLATAPDTLGFVGLAEKTQLVQRQMSLRVTGPESLALELSLNGTPIAQTRIGEHVYNGQKQAIEYVALSLQAGENEFVLTGRDSFGNIRETQHLEIIAPGEPARVQLIAPETAMADPTQPVPLVLQIVDAEGRPTAALVEATLQARADQFDIIDTSEQVPGLQTLIEDGQAQINLIPASLVGTRTIRVETPFGPSEADIRFTPALETDRIAVGYIEGALGFDGNGTSSLPGLTGRDDISPFEDTEEGVEGAVYLKGRIFGNSLLTIRHDSARDTEDALFRSVEPDEFYPVYGDQSQRGFDARSRGKTFGKLEHGSSYVLFGDVEFSAASEVLQLGTFQRTLEGARGHFEIGRLSLDLYAGETDTGQVINELPALGISGPYDLNTQSVIQNSETVELITRDRDQPGVIIRTERLGRFSDYTLDFFTGTLIFNRPIAARDANLNPVSIRITFETDPGAGEDYWLFGGEASLAVNDNLTIGYRQLTSDGPEGSPDDQTVRAAFVAADIGSRGRFELEAAQSIDPLDRSGTGIRASYEQQTDKGAFGARLATTTGDFNAPGAGVNAGRDEAGVFANTRLGTGALSGEAIYTADQASEAERYGLVGRYEIAISEDLRVRAGGRFIDDTNASGVGEDALTVIAGIGWSPKALGSLNLDLEAEQEVTSGTQSRIALGADYALSPKARLYAQGEYSGSRSGSFGLADTFNDDVTLRLGGEYRWTERVTAFSEYRSNTGLFDAGVANGLTAGWSLSPSLNLRTRVEHVQPIGEQFRRNTSAGIGATWEPEDKSRIIDGDLEYAAGEGGQRSWFFSASAGQRWKDITFLARNRYAQTLTSGERRTRDRLRAGAAYRPSSHNRLNALAWYEYETDRTPLLDEQRHIWSFGGEWQPGRNLRWRGRLAGQELSVAAATFDQSSTTVLLQSGAELDVHKRINLALNASLIGDSEFDNLVWGAGGEVNYRLVENFLIGVGYNYSEIKEERFERLNRTGVFLRLRVKFDQNAWNIFDALN